MVWYQQRGEVLLEYINLIQASFLRRPNRFTAWCRRRDNGQEVLCHVRNTGRCAELLLPQAQVWIQHSPSAQRKTAYTLVHVQKGSQLVNLDSLAPNRLFAEGINSGAIVLPGMGEVLKLRPEVTIGSSRLDYLVQGTKKTYYCEIKGVTLEQGETALFPDAPTQRGLRHLLELEQLAQQGYGAAVIFLVQMQAACFRPNREAQPEFAQALAKVRQAGVQVRSYSCTVTPEQVLVKQELPVLL